jgi:hypothetical protein
MYLKSYEICRALNRPFLKFNGRFFFLYLLSVNPIHQEPEPPFMHGFIAGINGSILCPIQWELDSLLETVRGHEEM